MKLFWLFVIVCTGVARGDVLWVTTANNSTIEMHDVKVQRLEGDRLVFTTAGNDASREAKQIARVFVDEDPLLSSAEEAFASGDFAAAAEKYQSVMNSAPKAWIKDWATRRLSDTAAKSGKFEPAVSAYIALAQTSPKLAINSRPALPAGNPTALESAANSLRASLTTATTTDQRQALLQFLFDIEQARQNTISAGDVADQLQQIEKRPEYTVAIAARALAQHQYDDVQKLIEQNRDTFADPSQQADALYLLAEAKYASAKSADELKDAALAYMRVVTFFADNPGETHVKQSQEKAAEILEKLNEKNAAAKLRSNASVAP